MDDKIKAEIEKLLQGALKKIEEASQKAKLELERHEEKMSLFGHRLRQAEFYYEKGEHENALKAYAMALELNPNSPVAWDGKGMTLGNLMRPQEALQSHEQALKLDPAFARAWNNKGVVLGELKRYKEALSAYVQTVKLDPGFATAWYNIAMTSAVLGDKEKMVEGLKQVLRLDGTMKEAILDDFQTFIDEGELEALVSQASHGTG
ncbi:MAG TPA: tetratricopeptide repeat protein [Candidatus Tripitaka californicus]|uniref:tetratricopeptide repeat protein n=1 Tax=Candidatus Tripitaka californicus TaxID=3367616 RepID=UPI004024B98C|nr:tetratricopeptide repeat protein [Planctomycetota bacterium]